MPEIDAWIIGLVSAIVTGLIAWGGFRMELRWLRADIERTRADIETVRQTASRAHRRLDHHLEASHGSKA